MSSFKTLVLACLASVVLLPLAARATTAAPTTLYSFAGGADGGNPVAPLISDGTLLYGTTPNISGAHCYPQCGTVFSLDPTSGVKTVLHTFAGRSDGSNPQAALVYVSGKLYGTTAGGGPYGQGTAFSVDLATAKLKILHSFSGGSDGASPLAALTHVSGVLYGTTSAGGPGSCGVSGCGTVFKINAKSGSETVLYPFQGGTDGQAPQSTLVYVNGTLYGTTTQGGGASACTNGCGTTFQVDSTMGSETVLHAFAGGSDGIAPQGGLLFQAGAIYGVTPSGGDTACPVMINMMTVYEPCGTVFMVDPTTSTESVISYFNSTDGGMPSGGLCVHRGKKVTGYGPTPLYGGNGYGNLYSVNLKNGTQTVLYNFTNSTDGGSPVGGLLSLGNALYGTTSSGGTGGFGTVFMLIP